MASEKDLYRQAQKGDPSAFEKWVSIIQPDTGRFAYQIGVSIEELPNFQRLSLQRLHKQIKHLAIEQVQNELFKIMVQTYLTHTVPFQIRADQAVLSFQEDDELHSVLQTLVPDQKISLVLSVFHQYTEADIGTVMGMPEPQAVLSVERGLDTLAQTLQLNKVQLMQRLEMLRKSYQRFVPPDSTEEQQIAEITDPVSKDVQRHAVPGKIKKKPVILLSTAGLFLAMVIGVSFFANDQQAQTAGTTEWQQVDSVTDDMIADWKSQYETIKATSPERLGMSPDQYGQLDYVKRADAEMKRIFSKSTVDSLEEDPEAMQLAVDRLFRQIETPRGMALSLSASSPVPTEEVDGFLRDYAAKTMELQQFADQVLLKYQEELESTAVMGELSPEKLQAQPDKFTEELRLVVEALPEYTLFPIVDIQGEHFRTIRDINHLQQQRPIIDHPYAGQYLSMLSNEPYFDESGFLLPLETIPQHLLFMEMALLDEWGETALFDDTEVAYQQVFWQMMKGNDNSLVFDEQGKVKNDYRNAWNNAASSNPMAFLLLPILEEMEASDWTASTHYEEL